MTLPINQSVNHSTQEISTIWKFVLPHGIYKRDSQKWQQRNLPHGINWLTTKFEHTELNTGW